MRGSAGYGKVQPAGMPLIPPAAGFKGGVPVPTARQQPWQQQQQQSWQEPWQKEDTGPPRVLTLELTQESQLTSQGFPPEAPAIAHDKSMTVFRSAHSILCEVVGDISTEVEMHHDTEWDIFPEIGEAIQRAGGEELCFSVVTCPNHGKWAVGIAAGKKGREVAGKLALAFSLLVDREPADLEIFCKNYPEFRAMLAEAGLLPPRGGPQKRSAALLPQAGGKGPAGPTPWAAAPAPSPSGASAPASNGGLPQFLWISLDPTASLCQEGLPSEGLCVYHDKYTADLFRSGQFVLSEVVAEVNNEVIITHDPDWDQMPEIAEAIKKGGGEDNCYAVATLPSHGIWAVGLAGGWKPRESACKLALSVALVASSGEIERFAKSYPDFVAFCQAAGTPGAVGLEPAPKKAKVEPSLPPAKGGGTFSSPRSWDGQPAAGAIPTAKGNGKKGNPFAGKKSFGKPLPRDAPIWVQLPQDQLAPEVLQEFGNDAVAVATDRPHFQLYQSIDAVLKDLVASPEEDITFIDDPNWDQFPEVGQALKPHSQVEEPIQLSTCSNLGCWGVGVGRTPDARRATAKVAVAAMIALKAAEVGEVPDLSSHPDFAEFVASVQPPI